HLRGRNRHGFELAAQLIARLHLPERSGEVASERAVHRTGNVAADWVEHLVLTHEPVGPPRIDEPELLALQRTQHVVCVRDEIAPYVGLNRSVIRASGDLRRNALAHSGPSGKTAVQYRNGVVTDPAAQKPQARRAHVGARIVRDDLRAVAYAQFAQKR